MQSTKSRAIRKNGDAPPATAAEPAADVCEVRAAFRQTDFYRAAQDLVASARKLDEQFAEFWRAYGGAQPGTDLFQAGFGFDDPAVRRFAELGDLDGIPADTEAVRWVLAHFIRAVEEKLAR
jgi:hypothetical protein